MTEALPDFLDDDDQAVEAILILGWHHEQLGPHALLRVVCDITGLGAGEDDVLTRVVALAKSMAFAQQWLDEPVDAVHDQIGKYEPPSAFTPYADQFAADHVEVARGIARGLVSALRMRSVA